MGLGVEGEELQFKRVVDRRQRLASVVESCLSKDPKSRPADASALANELGWILHHDLGAAQAAILEMALRLLETASEPRATEQAPYAWPGGDTWKRLIFSAEQPFLEGEAHDNWLAAKAEYKRRRAQDPGEAT